MKLEHRIRILAGTLVLTSLGLSQLHNPWWLLLAAFVGFNLIQSAITGFCPAAKILARIFPEGGGCCCGGHDEKEAGGCCGGEGAGKQGK